ncbi:hypothetical protein RCJ22_10795, partial [Vibrio sp. FNV 38]|nr:hypothetical protein [Vibrio sp. FNV 38]
MPGQASDLHGDVVGAAGDRECGIGRDAMRCAACSHDSHLAVGARIGITLDGSGIGGISANNHVIASSHIADNASTDGDRTIGLDAFGHRTRVTECDGAARDGD